MKKLEGSDGGLSKIRSMRRRFTLNFGAKHRGSVGFMTSELITSIKRLEIIRLYTLACLVVLVMYVYLFLNYV